MRREARSLREDGRALAQVNEVDEVGAGWGRVGGVAEMAVCGVDVDGSGLFGFLQGFGALVL